VRVNVLDAMIVGGCVAAAPCAARAQTPSPSTVANAVELQSAGDRLAAARAEAQAREQRYHIGVLERVLENAVEHGVTVTRDRLQAIAQMPADLLVSDNAHARGFRLEGYGVFFDVSVPSFETTLWTMRTLDQNDLGLDSAIRELKELVKGNTNAEQALKRVELQVSPVSLTRPAADRNAAPGARNATGATASAPEPQVARPVVDPILSDPNEAYRGEVIQALKDAMLDHSSSLGIGPNEWLTIAARGNDDRPRLAAADGGSSTRVIRLRGSDLTAYLARQITKEEALERIEIRIY
jgi:exonuclease VII small subunit